MAGQGDLRMAISDCLNVVGSQKLKNPVTGVLVNIETLMVYNVYTVSYSGGGGNGFRFSEFGLFFDIGTHLVPGYRGRNFGSGISGLNNAAMCA